MKDLKKMLFLSALLALFAVTPMLAGNDVPTITITPTGFAKKFSLVIENLAGKATVRLRAANGEVLAQEDVDGTVYFAKIFNLEQLPAGEYQVSIATDTRETVQPLHITDKSVVLDLAARHELFVPTINVKADFIDVSLFNNRIASVEVKIINDNGDTIFSDEAANIIKLERRYNTAKLAKGNYILSVTMPGRTYYKEFSVK